MTGYVRTDTTNNISDGSVINAADLDNEFNGVQTAFNSSSGHKHDGTAAEGAPITKIGPAQEVVVSISSMSPKTTNTVDLGTSSLKYKDGFFAGNNSVGGTLAVTGVTTLTAQPVLSSLTASSAVATDASKGLVSVTNTGTGNNVLATSPTLVTPILGTPASGTVTNLTGTASININGTVGATAPAAGAFTTLSTTGAVTITGGTANGVPYLNGSKVLTTGTALTFDGTNLGIGTTAPSYELDVQGTTAISSITSTSTAAGNQPILRFQHSGNNSYQIKGGSDLQFLSDDGTNERMRLTTSGNLGLGVVPSAWGGTRKAMQIATGAFASATDAFRAWVSTNAYNNGTSWEYTASTSALLYEQATGAGHLWFTAPSGTAGNAISFTQAMTLDTSGNLGIGTTAPSYELDVQGATAVSSITSTSTTAGNQPTLRFQHSGNNTYQIKGGSDLQFLSDDGTNERMRLTSAGNLGIGTAVPSASAILDAQSTTKGVRMPNMTTTQKNAIASPAAGLMVFDTTLAKLCVYSNAAWQTITSV